MKVKDVKKVLKLLGLIGTSFIAIETWVIKKADTAIEPVKTKVDMFIDNQKIHNQTVINNDGQINQHLSIIYSEILNLRRDKATDEF